MPNYEYRCQDCGRRFEIFLTYSEYGTREIKCTACQSTRVQRRIGRIRVTHSEEGRLQNLAQSADMNALEDDPRALGRMMREMSHEVGEDMGPEFHEVVNRLEKGQSPEDIEKELPELGNALGDGDGNAGFGGMGDSFD
ncbi:MAG: zinc ribbon domain-containing protein [Anaerolineaceae bacterium]|nr:zinc ribbon domain-containing protein [Anaerolineaceae bacterium]NTV35739.1 zinc ribbon domain-containing protein [Anaerolineaceae bacterium]